MRITRISVSRLPGIDRPFEIETITPGLNIILGPNGVGKSSIRRVVRQSLWPSATQTQTRVRITWDGEGTELISELDGGVTWQRRGENISPPEVSPRHLARCYTVTLRDLLEANNPVDRKMAEDIRVLMAGGYDLPAVKSIFQIKKSQGKNEALVLDKAAQKLERLQIERRSLSEDEDKLSSLQGELESARIATRECNLLTAAMELAGKRTDMTTLRADMERFPPGMNRLRGDERSRIQDIEEEIKELEQSISRRSRNAKEAEQELAENELPDGAVDDDILRIEEERVQQLERLALEKDRREEELKQCDGVTRAAEAALGIRIEKSLASDPAELRLDYVDSWARKAIRLKDLRQSIEVRMAVLKIPDGITSEDVNRVRRASDLLGDWLSSPGSEISSTRRTAAIRISATLIVLIGSLLAALINPWFILLGGLGLGILLMSFISWKSEGDQRAFLKEQFEKLDLPFLPSWKRTDVQERVRELGEEIRQGERALADGIERERLQGELRILEDESRPIENDRAKICRDAGIDPAATELSIVDFIDRLKAFREASRTAEAARVAAANASDKYEEDLKEVQDFLGRALGKTPVENLEARHLMISLKEQSATLRNARFKLKTAKAEITDRKAEIARKQIRIKDIFQSAGIKLPGRPAADLVLDEMLSLLDEYREKTRQAESLRGWVAERETQLADRDDLLKLDRVQAESRLELARGQEQQRDDLVARIQQIRDRIEMAVGGNALEIAMALVESKSFQLEDRYAETLAAASGRLLLEKAEDKYEEQSRPAVLDRAGRWFSEFTRARYELLISGEEGSATFRARETSTGRGVGLDELSDGTRVQLLLSTRLAFATQAESSGPLPLFLDEALTTSDLERFRAIAECLIILAGEGRQIFYLTTNPSDSEYLAAICRDVNQPEPNLIDLGRIRTIAAAESDIVKLSPPVPASIPAPDGMTAAEYGEYLEVPPFNPSDPTSGCHLFYILSDDLKLLYIVMQKIGVRTVGQWESFVRINPDPPRVSPEEKDRINGRIKLLGLFLEQWSIGRGKPIDREVLLGSGVVSDRYIDSFSELAQELGNDGCRFIECLEAGDDPRTARYTSSKKQVLRDYLEENEFIDTRERLTKEEITAVITARTEVLSGFSPEDIIYQISGLWSRANR